ncbi:hypothetical protein [Aliarcobacter butzleri]|uniref:Uncharacterized protein n=1 Tax=Aliarcobacter butzleri L348 TaxID=1447256 RepID=A0A0G9JTC8_9BACT|nr:hypothetical protein [Aliarcobacter butzleri]KLD97543.1 hypothetical protein AA20_10970 [Aliarcobacter butzleri L348]
MNTIEILIYYSKLKTVQDLVNNIDLVTDIVKDDVYKIAKSKQIYFADFDFTYSTAVSVLNNQIKKKHLNGVKRFFKLENIEDKLNWLISRILNNMLNLTTNPKYKLYFNPKKIDIYKGNYQENDDFERIIQILDIQKLDKSIIKEGLCRVWQKAIYDKDFDYLDFTELCEKYGFEADKVLGSHASTQIQFKKCQAGKFNYQLELII